VKKLGRHNATTAQVFAGVEVGFERGSRTRRSYCVAAARKGYPRQSESAYDHFLRTQGWDRTTVDQQVLTPLDDRTIFGTPADATSIMCYQLPGEITRDGQPIVLVSNRFRASAQVTR